MIRCSEDLTSLFRTLRLFAPLCLTPPPLLSSSVLSCPLLSSLVLPPNLPRNLNNHLQLPGIPHHILNGLLLRPWIRPNSTHLINLGEVDPPVLDAPAVLARKVNDGALRVEEEEVLGAGDGQGGVGGLGARGDFAADGVEEILIELAEGSGGGSACCREDEKRERCWRRPKNSSDKRGWVQRFSCLPVKIAQTPHPAPPPPSSPSKPDHNSLPSDSSPTQPDTECTGHSPPHSHSHSHIPPPPPPQAPPAPYEKRRSLPDSVVVVDTTP